MRGTVRERLYARLTLDPDTGCLLWGGAIIKGGYGRIFVSGEWVDYVHRVAWQLEYGPVPDGLVIDHVRERGCRYRHCANVAHLEPVTTRENTQRAMRVDRAHCPRGHPYDEANTYIFGARRHCRACNRERQRERRRAT